MTKHTHEKGEVVTLTVLGIILFSIGVSKVVNTTGSHITGNNTVQLGCGQQVYFLPENQVETISAYLAKNGVKCEILGGEGATNEK